MRDFDLLKLVKTQPPLYVVTTSKKKAKVLQHICIYKSSSTGFPLNRTQQLTQHLLSL